MSHPGKRRPRRRPRKKAAAEHMAHWPEWLALERVLPLTAESGAPSVEALTNLSAYTIRRRYPKLILVLSPRRRGMKLRNALAIANGSVTPTRGRKVEKGRLRRVP
jgi:hypothetical protein